MRLWTDLGGPWAARVLAFGVALSASGSGEQPSWTPAAAWAGDAAVVDARDAYRVRDKQRLLALRDGLIAERHPLAPWADYWYLQVRLAEVNPPEVDDFLARWGDAYVADRLRNDWLLELGKRRDWSTYLRIQSGFRMNDDREVICFGVLARQQLNLPMEGASDLREQARLAWWSQKDPDNGCEAMSSALFQAGVLSSADVWKKLRLAMDNERPKVIPQVARLLGDPTTQAIMRLMGQPQAFLKADTAMRPNASGSTGSTGAVAQADEALGKKKSSKAKVSAKKRKAKAYVPPPPPVPVDHVGPLNALALQRWASLDPQSAADALAVATAPARWHLSREDQAWVWASIGRAAAWRLMPQAVGYYERGLLLAEMNDTPVRWVQTWPADTLAWLARAAMRSALSGQRSHWTVLDTAYDAMSPELKNDPTWLYWRARSLLAQAPTGPAGEPRRLQARELLARIASPTSFYGLLAMDQLPAGSYRTVTRPAAPGKDETAQAKATPGLDRALRLYDLGWRSEGAREWNYTLSYGKSGGMSDRELLAAADLACDREIWDRCINTSERTRQDIDLFQRFPTPWRRDVLKAAQEVGLDPAYMYGLIRQESRFQVAAKSTVGAAGLMQVMPATAQWTAKKLGMTDFQGEQITDRDTNLKIGAGYLKLLIDDFGGSQAMAAAAYNAGPGRPRRWREGARLDAAAWAENIPFNETRDYVKKVLANAVAYGHVLHGKPLSIKTRLGGTIGPRGSTAPPENDDLP